jgi:formyltetrahydrofolate synthetase
VVADRVALRLVDAVVTEGGFGADMGFQKFVDIKCRLSGLRPSAAVIVATIRALRMHGGADDADAVRQGAANLAQHIAIVGTYGVPAVVAINAFPDDRSLELDIVREVALASGARDVVVARHYAEGGAGAEDLARSVWELAGEGAPGFRFLSADDATLTQRIHDIATRIYGAAGVALSGEAERSIGKIERLGYGALPICMAKTQSSLSHDPALKGRPTGFTLPIREARLFAGAGFVTAFCGDMRTMPGLPAHPNGEGVDIDERGRIVGLF